MNKVNATGTSFNKEDFNSSTDQNFAGSAKSRVNEGEEKDKNSRMAESVSSGGSILNEKELRKLLKDRELFTTPRVITRFMYTGYIILLLFLGSLLIFVNIEVTFAERLQ